MKYILSIILFFLLAGSLFAQNEQDQVIFKAMQDEMQRSKDQLMLPGMQKPYYCPTLWDVHASLRSWVR